MSSDPTVVSPRAFSKGSPHLLRVLMLLQDIRSILFLVHSSFGLCEWRMGSEKQLYYFHRNDTW